MTKTSKSLKPVAPRAQGGALVKKASKSHMLQIRMTPAEIKVATSEARRRGLGVSELVRMLIDVSATRTRRTIAINRKASRTAPADLAEMRARNRRTKTVAK